MQDRVYFKDVQVLMVQKGFAHISTVTIDNNDVPYHVSGNGRSTSLFFHYLGKALITQLEYHEHANNSHLPDSGYWSLDFYIQYHRLERIPVIYNLADVTLPDFRYQGGSSDEDSAHVKFHEYGKEPMQTTKVVENVMTFTNLLIPWLHSGRMDILQVTNFPPHYSFP